MVDRLDTLARTRTAHHDARPFQLGIIEGVQRLPAFHQHVVADVHHVVDRCKAHRLQAPDQPARRGPHFHPPDDPRGVSRAKVGAVDLHFDELFNRCVTLRRACLGNVQFAAEEHGHFPGDAQMPQAVGPVARHFQVDGQIASHLAGFFVVQPCHRQPPLELFERHVQGDVLFQPVPGDDHGLCRLGRVARKTEGRLSRRLARATGFGPQ